ncbi:MAG: hypothetical protein WDO69_13580 [Pseudomonadota bacterium]
MKRFLPDYKSLRAFLGLAVIVLQMVGALHFSLVRHGYSAAMGGVVHLHPAARVAPRQQAKGAAPRTTTLTADAPSCGAELCPVGNAPHSSAPRIALLAAGVIAFGEARLLSERATCSSESRRLFLSAPKTSPPV